MSRLVFGEGDPAQYVVPASECMECRHPVDHHCGDASHGCHDCDCTRSYCGLHDALDGEHECAEQARP